MKRRFLVSAAVVALLSVACGGTAAPAEAPVKQDRVMGFVPSQTSSIVQTNADLLGTYLSKKTGYNITPRVLTSYAAVTEGMTSNNVDIGWVGPLVNVKWNINSIADLKGKKFAFGDPLSTSSNLWPRYVMKKNGLNPDSDVTGVNISNQTQISVNVCQGTVDAGAIYDDARKNAGAETSCPGILTKTKILATTDPPIPGDPQMIRHNLNSAQKQKLKDAMIAMGSDPTIQPALKALYTIDSLVPAQDSDYHPVRDIVRQVKPEMLKPTPTTK